MDKIDYVIDAVVHLNRRPIGWNAKRISVAHDMRKP